MADTQKFEPRQLEQPVFISRGRLKAELRKEPDIKQMVYALIAIAEKIANEKEDAMP